MKNLNTPQPEYSVSIVTVGKGIPPKNADNVRQALVILLKNNPFEEGKSPQTIQTLGFNIPKTEVIEKPPQKRAGEELADYFRKYSMSAKAGEIMNEARKDFREGFAFKHDLDENHIMFRIF